MDGDREIRDADRRLAARLLDARPVDPLSVELAAWFTAVPRFREFADTYADKIRKKLRGAADADAVRDIRAELLVARLLLADRAFSVAFEAHGSGRTGPDFTVRYRESTTFDLEVTRPRRVGDDAFAATLLGKLRQFAPSVPNVLLVAIDAGTADDIDAGAVIRSIRTRADTKDETFFEARGIAGSRAFYDRFLRLSAVIVLADGSSGDGRASLWENGSARIAIPGRAARAVLRALRA